MIRPPAAGTRRPPISAMPARWAISVRCSKADAVARRTWRRQENGMSKAQRVKAGSPCTSSAPCLSAATGRRKACRKPNTGTSAPPPSSTAWRSTISGPLYLAGTGAPRNYALAKTSFEQAAERGNADAMNNLGLLYLEGRGVQRDIKLARTWFDKAAALGNAQARENSRRIEQAGLLDGAQVAARRASCVQTCATLHRSYVSSVCERYSAEAESGKPERTKCIDMSLTLAKQCRDSCREWAPTPVADNKCVRCYRAVIACSVSRGPPESQGNDGAYATDSQGCLAELAQCAARCPEQPAPMSGEKPD